MFKKFLLSIVVVYVAFEVLDFLFHGLIMSGVYSKYPTLWRPDMMKLMWVMYLTTFLSTIGFVYIYYKLIGNKSPFKGLWYGLTFGFITGLGMGYGTYSMFPIPYIMAVTWFLWSIVEYGFAGWLTGMIIKEAK